MPKNRRHPGFHAIADGIETGGDGLAESDEAAVEIKRIRRTWRTRQPKAHPIPNVFLDIVLPECNTVDLALEYERRRTASWPASGQNNTSVELLSSERHHRTPLSSFARLPFDIEIIRSKSSPHFPLVDLWKHKLRKCAKIFSETGKPPSFTDMSQRHLAGWYFTVSDLYARGALPQEAAWLATHFGQISELNEYFAFAHSIGGEKNIRGGLGIFEIASWAEWREGIVRQHRKGMLLPDIVSHFKEFSRILDG